jgi:hypothetical protein
MPLAGGSTHDQFEPGAWASFTGALGTAHLALLSQSARGSYLGCSFAGGARV